MRVSFFAEFVDLTQQHETCDEQLLGQEQRSWLLGILIMVVD
jgi:hypothetical protein